MPLVYRGMVADPGNGNQPQVKQQDANALGVRVPADVVTYLQAEVPWVNPSNAGKPQGMSVAFESGCNLPPHRRPKGPPWNGTGKAGLIMWQLDDSTLVAQQLASVAAPLDNEPQHAVIAPGQAMSLAQYQGYLGGTVANWTRAPAPSTACAATVARETEAMGAELDEHADAVANGADPSALVDALVEANRRGVSASTLVSGIEAAVQRAEESGNDDGAEALRTILDRITGYCSPTFRIQLN